MPRFNSVKEGERYIALQIIGAQASSDYGKWNDFLACILSDMPELKHVGLYTTLGYRAKVSFIINAINSINCINRMTHGHSVFSYYVVAEEDQNGYDSILVYFEFDVYGRHEQVSFHTPKGRAGSDLLRWIGKGRPTTWNRVRGGSRIAAERLLRRYFPESDIIRRLTLENDD